ncbi:hypothetical protein ACTJKJ_19080 [Roseateles sp. 22389]|uniref:hypothetical protein n=1 Tax=Roseateles sp. 22389 TaxID=3453916 RepID=UPI003F85FEF9
MQALLGYFNDWIEANEKSIAAGRIHLNQALLVMYSESPRVDSGLPASVCKHPVDVFPASHTLCDGIAVAVENLSEVVKMKTSFEGGADEAFAFIKEHIGSDRTFALLMMAQERMFVHDAGVDINEWAKEPRAINLKRLSPASITPALIDEQLNEFHIDALATHRCRTARLMWNITEQPSVLNPQPELHVQSGLLTWFSGIYRYSVTFVDEEVTLAGGRVDIRIARANQAKRRVITMIELKVLKPDDSPTDNLKWAHKGIQQAHDYKTKTRDTDAAFACIYDARRDKGDPMPSLAPDAAEKGVLLKVLPMAVPKAKKPRKPKSVPSGPGPSVVAPTSTALASVATKTVARKTVITVK